jgi:hypothetical protein
MARSASAGNEPVSPGRPSVPAARRSARRIVIAILLAIAIAGTLGVPIYARPRPELGGFPFFYWYQLILVPVVALTCWLCSLLLRAGPPSEPRPGDSGEPLR